MRPGFEPEFPNACAAPGGTNTQVPGPPRTVRSPRRRSSLSYENVKDLLDFGVVMRTSVEPWRDRKLKQPAVLRVFGRDQIFDPGLMQGDTVSLTVMQNESLYGHLRLLFA
jgi:hypothetical protein